MRTFIKSVSVAGIAATALVVGSGVAAANPDDYERGVRGTACTYRDGTLGLDSRFGFVIVCRDGVWSFLKSAD